MTFHSGLTHLSLAGMLGVMNGAFPSFHAFLQMGGYAATVWPAYGIVLFVLLVQFIFAKYRFSRLYRYLAQKYAKSS